MKTNLIVTFVLILFVLQVSGQEMMNKFDLRLGAGISLLGSGDMLTFNYENELNYQLNQYFTGALSVNLGRSNLGVGQSASFTQGNLNIFISPFKNSKQIDFRLGTGITYYHVSDVDFNYEFDKRNAIGFNIIIENTYLFTDKWLAGLKLFTQPYANGDINTGVVLKLGMKL